MSFISFCSSIHFFSNTKSEQNLEKDKKSFRMSCFLPVYCVCGGSFIPHSSISSTKAITWRCIVSFSFSFPLSLCLFPRFFVVVSHYFRMKIKPARRYNLCCSFHLLSHSDKHCRSHSIHSIAHWKCLLFIFHMIILLFARSKRD